MIDILLASYNGEKYIVEQIESILNQTYDDWFLYIKDDCSTDNTVKIILDYEQRYKDKIKVIISNKPSGSAKNNFFSMLQYSKNDYIMTCDQDDIWLSNKVELTFNKMKEAEKENSNIPILVHTDLKVVDENLKVISDSLFRMQDLNSGKDKLNNLLVQNIVTGCTVMVNKMLISKIKEIPEQAIMHDWWMALIASALGEIIFINVPTVLYRQHKENDVGAKNVNSVAYILKRLGNIKNIKNSIYDTYLQAENLMNSIGDLLCKDDYFIINQYSILSKYSKIKKVQILTKYRFWKNNIIRVLGQLIFC